jgi:hypothetical protein
MGSTKINETRKEEYFDDCNSIQSPLPISPDDVLRCVEDEEELNTMEISVLSVGKTKSLVFVSLNIPNLVFRNTRHAMTLTWCVGRCFTRQYEAYIYKYINFTK